MISLMNAFLMGILININKINGIIYIHDANDTARFHFDSRTKGLKSFFGPQVCTSAVVVFTRYDDLNDRKKKELNEKVIKIC